jgi:prolipoprotein diacylglyceryltransferase
VTFPVIFAVGPLQVPAHLVFEALAYTVGFEVYRRLRQRYGDPIDTPTRWTVIAAAAIGAAVGSKLLFLVEDPRATMEALRTNPVLAIAGKTIVGGLLGGTIGVELAKSSVGERRSTGDLFVVPLCLGIAIGRVGCFLSGLADRTYGSATTLPWGVDFGDGVARHPTQIYEIAFVLALAMALHAWSRRPRRNGDAFKLFMLAYLTFRLIVDGMKPDVAFGGLSTIQWASLAAIVWYARFVPGMMRAQQASLVPSA